MSGNRKSTALEEAARASDAHDGGGTPGEKMVIRVRRGALRRFDHLTAKSTGLPVDIKWDRRLAERRAEPDATARNRRQGERRQAPPFTWDVADFLVEGDSSRPDEDSSSGGSPKKR